MSEIGKVYQIQYPTNVSGKVYNVRDVSGEQNVSGKVYQVANVNGGGGSTIRNQNKQITKNGTYTADAGYTGLGTVTVNVSSEGGSKTKYGATVDAFLGDVDANGVLQKPSGLFDLSFNGVKSVSYAMDSTFLGNSNLKSVSFPDMTEVKLYQAFRKTFSECTNIIRADLPNLTTISSSSGCYYMFSKCTNLESFDLDNLTVISGYNCVQNMFSDCPKLKHAGLPKVKSVSYLQSCDGMFSGCSGLLTADISSLESINAAGAWNRFFEKCTNLPILSFPSLKTVDKGAFGSSSSAYAFYGCTGLIEIHFRADAQATIEAMSGYSEKWGATNATIYFDLIGTITVNGVAYARNEPNSIYVEYDKTYVAWADESGNIVYTTAGAEPAVGTVVYSDEGTTQVGTVSAVA